jgi:hypothetical protein
MVGVDKSFVPPRIKSNPESPRILSTEQKGQIALAKVLIEASRKGVVVSQPTTPARYDLILDMGGRFYRAQVKYAGGKSPRSQGAVRLDLRKRKRCYTREEVDVLLVYLPAIDKVCWFSAELFHNRTGLFVRLQPALNGQKMKCLMAVDFVW